VGVLWGATGRRGCVRRRRDDLLDDVGVFRRTSGAVGFLADQARPPHLWPRTKGRVDDEQPRPRWPSARAGQPLRVLSTSMSTTAVRLSVSTVVAILALAACGSDDDSDANDGEAGFEEPSLITSPSITSPSADESEEGSYPECEAGADMTFTTGMDSCAEAIAAARLLVFDTGRVVDPDAAASDIIWVTACLALQADEPFKSSTDVRQLARQLDETGICPGDLDMLVVGP